MREGVVSISSLILDQGIERAFELVGAGLPRRLGFDNLHDRPLRCVKAKNNAPSLDQLGDELRTLYVAGFARS